MGSRRDNDRRTTPQQPDFGSYGASSSSRNAPRRDPLARTSWIPAKGINREVIQAEVQRFLGADAYSFPKEHEGERGFAIVARQELTSAMVQTLKEKSRAYLEEREALERQGRQTRSYEESAASGDYVYPQSAGGNAPQIGYPPGYPASPYGTVQGNPYGQPQQYGGTTLPYTNVPPSYPNQNYSNYGPSNQQGYLYSQGTPGYNDPSGGRHPNLGAGFPSAQSTYISSTEPPRPQYPPAETGPAPVNYPLAGGIYHQHGFSEPSELQGSNLSTSRSDRSYSQHESKSSSGYRRG